MNREIPHNIDAEQSVLGSMFLTKKALDKGIENINEEMFYLDSHKKIFNCIKDLSFKNIPVDLTTVIEELNNHEWLGQVGGVEYLTEIIESVPTAANIDEYIKIIEDKSILRRLIEEATTIITDSYDVSNDINEVIEQAEKRYLMYQKVCAQQSLKLFKMYLLKHSLI